MPTTSGPIQVDNNKRTVAFFRDASGRLHPVLRPEDVPTNKSEPEEQKTKSVKLPSQVKTAPQDTGMHYTSSIESTSTAAPSWGGAGSGITSLAPHIQSLASQGFTVADILRHLLKDPRAHGGNIISAMHHTLGPGVHRA